jgi:hypothetical protein
MKCVNVDWIGLGGSSISIYSLKDDQDNFEAKHRTKFLFKLSNMVFLLQGKIQKFEHNHTVQHYLVAGLPRLFNCLDHIL